MNSINQHALNPPESPRAITIANLREPLLAVAKHFKRERWLSKSQEAAASKFVQEYDELVKALQSDPRIDGDVAFDQQQTAVGAGKGANDVWSRQELREEARIRIHAARQRLIAITGELSAMIAPIKTEAESLCLAMANDLEADERKLSESVGIPYVQASLTVQVLRDIPRRLVKLIPPAGVNGNVRAMLQPFMNVDPVAITQPHVARLEAKAEHAKSLMQRLRDAMKREPAKRTAEIAKALEAKERRKRELAKQGVIKLGTGKPDPTWAALHGPDAPLAPTPAAETPAADVPAPNPELPKA